MDIPILNIAILDDHQMVAALLEQRLRTYDFVKEVTVFANGQVFLDRVKNAQFNLIFLDLLMPQMHGHEVISGLKGIKGIQLPKIIVLSSIVNPGIIKETLRVGANGYLSKNTSLDQIEKAITAIFEHEEVYVDSAVVQHLIKSEFLTNPEEKLTSREKEVLNYLCKGKSPKEITTLLSLSLPTIQTYIQRLLNKFEVNRTSELIVKALKQNVVAP